MTTDPTAPECTCGHVVCPGIWSGQCPTAPVPAAPVSDVEALAEVIHERFAPDHIPHWSDLDETEWQASEAWDIARAVLAAGYVSPTQAAKDRAEASAAAWDKGCSAGIRIGESGYVAGTNQKLHREVNPYRADRISGGVK